MSASTAYFRVWPDNKKHNSRRWVTAERDSATLGGNSQAIFSSDGIFVIIALPYMLFAGGDGIFVKHKS